MSRYNMTVDAKSVADYAPMSGLVDVAYGFDHVLGYFYQVFDVNDEPVVDRTSRFSKMPRIEFMEFLEKICAPAKHINKVALDLPF